MNIVITMGGQGKRFKEAGYKDHKYRIEVKGKTLFEWSMHSLKEFFTEYFIFVVKKEDKASDFIKKKCIDLGIKNFKIVEIEYLTKGQAETVIKAEPYWNEKEELLIYNIDTYIEGNQIKRSGLNGDGCIPCFKAEGYHWSFVKVDKKNKAILVKEKERISDNCSIGLYYFKSCCMYKEAYCNYYSENNNYKEEYIAPIYNYLIKRGKNIFINIIDKKYIHVLGTPEELREFANI